MEQLINIRCKNNKKTLKVSIGSTLSEIFSQLDLHMEYGPVSAKVNNKVEGMHYRVYKQKERHRPKSVPLLLSFFRPPETSERKE